MCGRRRTALNLLILPYPSPFLTGSRSPITPTHTQAEGNYDRLNQLKKRELRRRIGAAREGVRATATGPRHDPPHPSSSLMKQSASPPATSSCSWPPPRMTLQKWRNCCGRARTRASRCVCVREIEMDGEARTTLFSPQARTLIILFSLFLSSFLSLNQDMGGKTPADLATTPVVLDLLADRQKAFTY